MAWLWNSWEEYVEYVHPVEVRHSAHWRLSHQISWFETDRDLWGAATRLRESAISLRKLGFTGNDRDRPPSSPSLIEQARKIGFEAVGAGEELLLHHKRLATADAAYGFLHQHDILEDEHWDRYKQTGRIAREIHQLASDISELLKGYEEFVQAGDKFIVRSLDLPSSLEADFRLARNLFSVGFDEVGLLIAGRGLEGVVQKIAEVRKISLAAKGKTTPACEANLHDLIEVMCQVRWKTKGTPLIAPETKALLHYIRALRNSGAHPSGKSRPPANPRETATVIAETANRLWKEVSTTRARLAPTTVTKTW